MVDLTKLKVSLTKNGYFKFAELLKAHTAREVIEHADGRHEGIDLSPSQISNMMDVNPLSGEPPTYWDEIRGLGHKAIDAFTLTALLFSHGRLIQLFQTASDGRDEFTGYFLRGDLSTKEYTNLAFALACFGVADYRRGAGAVKYDLTPVVYYLRTAGELVRALLRSKLMRAGWVDPARSMFSTDHPLTVELEAHKFNRVMSMSWDRFAGWLDGRLELPPYVGRFGLREVGLFATPIPLADENTPRPPTRAP